MNNYFDTEHPLELGVEMAPEEGEIVQVGRYRHMVQWSPKNGGQLSSISYCNGCGCPVVGEAVMHKVDGKKVEREFHICPGCDSFQGWVDEIEEREMVAIVVEQEQLH